MELVSCSVSCISLPPLGTVHQPTCHPRPYGGQRELSRQAVRFCCFSALVYRVLPPAQLDPVPLAPGPQFLSPRTPGPRALSLQPHWLCLSSACWCLLVVPSRMLFPHPCRWLHLCPERPSLTSYRPSRCPPVPSPALLL